ncbi:Holliday junction resolvase RuvX [Brachybacterium timonense]|uniref:Holliday junction resolvase RuvX n=1 Tax=Brachybacterium timonense TaxID=2050896 RepID=UPI000D0AEAC0|nr:Holliday junction resolvase RuvX [Brachybacterium timonense]
MSGQEDALRGVRLGVDVGDVRVGLARSDRDGLIATPIATLERDTAMSQIVEQVRECEARAIMVGLPRSLNGSEGPAAAKARVFAQELADSLRDSFLAVEVRLVDERLSTVSAHRAMHASGRRGRRHREVVDQVAAVTILQTALETERSTGRRAGEAVEATDRAGQTGASVKEDTDG